MEVVQAVILKTFNYNDTQKIVRAFSKAKGYMTFITPAYIFKKSQACYYVMQVLEIEYIENPKYEFHKLKSITPVYHTSSVYSDIYKMNIVLLWGEILDILLRKEGRNESLYKFIYRSIEYLNETSADVANFNLFFLYRLSGYVGFRINTDTYKPGYVFNLHDGNFVAADAHSSFVSGPNTAKIIYELHTCKVEYIKEIALNRESRRILLDIVLLFFSIHLNIDFNVKSIKVIREVFE